MLIYSRASQMKKLTSTLFVFFFILVLSGCSTKDSPKDPIMATIDFQIPCTDQLHVQSHQDTEGSDPFIIAEPQCGILSKQDGTQGTSIDVMGKNFYPNTEITLLWEDNLGIEFRQRQSDEYVRPFTSQEGEFYVSFEMQYRNIPRIESGEYVVWKLKAFQGELAEDTDPFDYSALFEHVIISVFGAIIGISTGIFIGYQLARSFLSISRTLPNTRVWAIFFPSRTIVITLLLFLSFPFYLAIKFGIGVQAGIIGTSLLLFILSICFSIPLFVSKVVPESFNSRLISGIRTLTSLSVFFTTLVGHFGLGGVTQVALVHVNLLEFDLAFQYFLGIILLLLILDIVGGIVEFAIFKRENRIVPTTNQEEKAA
jgi:hypothetical protein